ncbi:MAG: hypothetical protein HYS27_23110 [Deltaproteobacteria bacterium]|nr:hypothetical protein [Deltaproteobacteria bacterium]
MTAATANDAFDAYLRGELGKMKDPFELNKFVSFLGPDQKHVLTTALSKSRANGVVEKIVAATNVTRVTVPIASIKVGAIGTRHIKEIVASVQHQLDRMRAVADALRSAEKSPFEKKKDVHAKQFLAEKVDATNYVLLDGNHRAIALVIDHGAEALELLVLETRG